jgi:glycosyltransferase involved in cell wall biosynthesis
MRIASVMTGAHPGGAEFAATELLAALAARGHECVILSDWSGIGRDSGIEVRPLELGPKLSGSTWPRLLARWPRLRAELRRGLEGAAPYDVLLLHYKKEQLLAPSLPERLRPRLAWAEWGPVPRQLRSGPGRLLYARAGRQVSRVLAISQGTMDSVLAAGVDPDRVDVVPNALRTGELGFDPGGRAEVRRQLGIGAGEFVVGCTSRFHPKKRIDVLVEAFERLPGSPHLVLAGSGESEADLRRLAGPLGSRVHFLPTPGRDSRRLFSAFDVCCFCPSPAEGSPTSVILGMLAARPCVATAGEGVAGLLGEGCGAIAHPENDPDAVAQLLAAYAADPERVRREGELAAERARRRFDAASVAALAERLLLA